MRNGQNKRMRGRNNRKSHNPLTRVYESNGPDIKIRGTASHVAEKYVQLARDAQASGDPVAAENYYQHAEHYFRLIAAVQEQFRQSQPNFYRPEGGSGYTDQQVYERASLGGGLGYTEDRLRALWDTAPFSLRVFRQMKKVNGPGPCFGEDFLWALLAAKGGSP